LAIDNGTRLEAEKRNDGNDSDCGVGMQRGQARRLHNIQKCEDLHSGQGLTYGHP